METLDLAELKPRPISRRISLPPVKDDEHWRVGRLRLHMAHAEPYRRLDHPSRQVPGIWAAWMTFAAMAVLTIIVAGVIAWIARRVL